jgi:hypothetical protein
VDVDVARDMLIAQDVYGVVSIRRLESRAHRGDVNNILGQDPVLGPLANNGGPTQTHALLAGSPAIDKGSNPNALAFDQCGTPFVRTSGAQTDIGAFEVQGAAPPPPPVTALDIPTLSQWGTVILSGLLGVWAVITGFGRRRRSGGS